MATDTPPSIRLRRAEELCVKRVTQLALPFALLVLELPSWARCNARPRPPGGAARAPRRGGRRARGAGHLPDAARHLGDAQLPEGPLLAGPQAGRLRRRQPPPHNSGHAHGSPHDGRHEDGQRHLQGGRRSRGPRGGAPGREGPGHGEGRRGWRPAPAGLVAARRAARAGAAARPAHGTPRAGAEVCEDPGDGARPRRAASRVAPGGS
mmetsp:Transcript_13145/g.41465  ORF Transcript_13145/g.41465 Transcript_13145/m.41465 type:complete len:208 (+) Transcript_13145:65-688(+)